MKNLIRFTAVCLGTAMLLSVASPALAADFNVEEYTWEELVKVREAVESKITEFEKQYAEEHANRIIELDVEENLVVAIGKNFKVTANVKKVVEDAPDKTTLVWKSSNDKVARVSNGTVQGVAPGTAEITVTAKDDENVVASFGVSVVKLTTGVKINEKILNVDVYSTVTITATVQPADATDTSLLWSSSDESIATVAEDGTISGISEGDCMIICTTADGSGKTASTKVHVNKVDIFYSQDGQPSFGSIETDFCVIKAKSVYVEQRQVTEVMRGGGLTYASESFNTGMDGVVLKMTILNKSNRDFYLWDGIVGNAVIGEFSYKLKVFTGHLEYIAPLQEGTVYVYAEIPYQLVDRYKETTFNFAFENYFVHARKYEDCKYKYSYSLCKNN